MTCKDAFSDLTQKHATHIFDCCANESVQIYRNDINFLLLHAPFRFLFLMHVFLKKAMREVDLAFNVLVDDIAPSFGFSSEVRRDF